MKLLLTLIVAISINCNNQPPVIVHQSGGQVQIGVVSGALSISKGTHSKDTLSNLLIIGSDTIITGSDTTIKSDRK